MLTAKRNGEPRNGGGDTNMERNARSVGRNLITRPAVTACLVLGVGGLLQWLAGRLPDNLPEGPAVGVLVVLAFILVALTKAGPRNA